MQSSRMTINLCGLLLGTLLAGGCGSPNVPAAPTYMLFESGATRAEVMQAAQEVLTRMHFPLEKFDVEHGIIRTRPLRGAQFFELWRSDNASGFDAAEANLETVRRVVELRVTSEAADPKPDTGATASLPPPAAGLRVECEATVQRLSLPENQIPSISQMYRMHSQSLPTTQRLAVTPQQQEAMGWIDLGRDPQLEAKILQRIERRLRRAD
jgi:hypothetical protein